MLIERPSERPHVHEPAEASHPRREHLGVGMSGVDLQAWLLTQGYRVPFIFMTAFPEETIRARALKAGAICFLTKPFDRLTLIRCLDTARERHGGGTSE
jgi:FixJ family two-component response regulator